jgi:hypothetical protein
LKQKTNIIKKVEKKNSWKVVLKESLASPWFGSGEAREEGKERKGKGLKVRSCSVLI